MRTETDRAALDYWDALSAAWGFPPPRTPSDEDVRWFRRSIAPVTESRGVTCGALLLGVTPVLASLPWQRNASLVALDWSSGMLQNVWVPPQGLAWATTDYEHEIALPKG